MPLNPQPSEPSNLRRPAPGRALLRAAPLLLAGVLLSLLAFSGCSDNDPRQSQDYLRSAADFSVDTVQADTLCDEPGPNFISDGFDPSETCRKTKKFLLRWERPEDISDFRGYRLYLDTTPGEAAKSWKATQGNDKAASVVIKETGKREDGLVFFFYDKNKLPEGIRASSLPDTFHAGENRIFGLDTNDRLDEKLKSYVFALVTRHGGDRAQGQPQYTRIVTGDKFPPNPFDPDILPGDRRLTLAWSRPNDPTSFFDPGLDTGVIKGYSLLVRLSGKQTPERSAAFKPALRYWVGGTERTGKFLDSVFATEEGPTAYRYFLPDSNRAKRGAPTLADSLKVVLDSLTPTENLDIILFAVDSAGNDNEESVPNASTIVLTDTTQPTMPVLEVIDSLTGKNSFVIRWKASRDRVAKEGSTDLDEGPTPNYLISSYRLSRILVRAPEEKADPFDRRDTLIEVNDGNARNEFFTDTVRFLPPGKTYRLQLTAEDASGYLSMTASDTVTTDSIVFSGADSGLTCPPGFVPIPSAVFRMGDSTIAPGTEDEKPFRPLRMSSFCIEPYEHRDSTGSFAVRQTWEQANAVCEALSPADSTMLCSEAEWERACEGFDRTNPHPHGIQSERNPSILQTSCNQATGDSAMAMSFDLRNPICLTNEGVHDMAGNLSEWVRDPYNAKAYASPDLKDSALIAHGFAFPSAGTGDSQTVHSIRGGNFLKPNIATAAAQALARCSNRDFPMQVRPLFRRDCVGDKPQIAVTYAEGLSGFRCHSIPDDLQSIAYSDIVVDSKDSTRLLLFRSGSTQRDTVMLTVDSTFRGRKPTDVRFTTQALARVIFERSGNPVDTLWDHLDTREMRDSSQASLKRILDRESPSSAWKPRMEGGRYDIHKLYAHTLTGSQLARPYFASRNVGFRCCSKPRTKPASAVVAGNHP